MPIIPTVGRTKGFYRNIFIAITAILWIGVILHLFPVYWALKSSITPNHEIFTVVPRLFPSRVTFLPYKVLLIRTLW